MKRTQNRSKMKQLLPFPKILAARAVLFWENAWPAALLVLAPVSILIIFGLFGILTLLPDWVHWAGLFFVLALTLYALSKSYRNFSWPSRRSALVRLEEDSDLKHAPLRALEDDLFNAPKDAVTDEPPADLILWHAHRDRLFELVAKTRLNRPHNTADIFDPHAIRFAVLGMLILGFIAAGPERWLRLHGVFNPTSAREVVASRVDMWIEPPGYTGVAPLQLTRGGDALPELADQIDIPAGSLMIAQVNGKRGVRLSYVDTEGERVDALPMLDDALSEKQNSSRTRKRDAQRLVHQITKNGLIDLKLGDEVGLWPVLAIEDSAPTVEIINPPVFNTAKNLVVHYRFEDDYGSAKALLEFRLDPDQDRPLDSVAFDQDSLSEIREVTLDGGIGASGARKITVPLISDPWAGLDILLKVTVIDGAGQRGSTQELAMTLEEREFFNPLAKSVIEQRQSLAVGFGGIQKIRDAFNALTVLPEEFYEDTAEYLVLRDAFWRVQRKRDDRYADTIDHFWPLALELEDKALELARRRLEAAIEALRRALEANESQEKVASLTEDLQEAIQNYLQALAAVGIPDGPPGGGEGENQIGTDTIQEMLNGIGDLSDSGANNAARQLLGDLERLLQNLKLTKGSGGEGGVPAAPDDEASGAGELAGELIGRQRELSDESFERGQEPGSDGRDLAGEQEAIARALEELLDGLEDSQSAGNQQGAGGTGGQNPDPEGKAADAFNDALREMQRAEKALEGGNFDGANEAMNDAISNLRDGARQLAEQEARQGEQGENGNASREASGRDPLGRPTGGTGEGSVDVPDLSDPVRTQQLIEEMRKRLSEQGRSPEEIEYLERLLQAF